MAPMSTRLCFVSRYTVPRKFSGIDSCASTQALSDDLFDPKEFRECALMRGNKLLLAACVGNVLPCACNWHLAKVPTEGRLHHGAGLHLKQEAVDHDQVADCELAARDAVRRQQHGAAERRAEDDVLSQVQHRQAVLGLQRRLFILCTRGDSISVQGHSGDDLLRGNRGRSHLRL